jgi:hypothetical protein
MDDQIQVANSGVVAAQDILNHSAEPIHAEKSQTQREHHWNRYEDEQSDAVGKNKQPRRERLLT